MAFYIITWIVFIILFLLWRRIIMDLWIDAKTNESVKLPVWVYCVAFIVGLIPGLNIILAITLASFRIVDYFYSKERDFIKFINLGHEVKYNSHSNIKNILFKRI